MSDSNEGWEMVDKETVPSPAKSYIQLFYNGLGDDIVRALELVFHVSPRECINEEWRRCVNVHFPTPALPITGVAWGAFREQVKRLFEQYKLIIGKDGGGETLNYCGSIEAGNLFEYSPGPLRNHFHDHADCWHNQSATRQVSVIAYLNDVVEGGETYFPLYDLTVRPTKGLVLMFPSNFQYMHRANPPISGKKLIAVTWLHFGPQTVYQTYPL